MPSPEKRSEPLIIDPRGAPLGQTKSLIASPISRRVEKLPSSGGGIVIPDVRTTLPKELKEKGFHAKDGLLYLPPEKDDRRAVETDITSAPKELREEQPVEYFGFKASEVAAVQAAHRRYAKNLYSGLPEQKAIYLSRLMEATGFPAEQAEDGGAVAFAHGMARVIARESTEKEGEKPSFVREGFLGKFCADFGQPRHPAASSEAGSYRNLALLLMPDVWNDLKPNERRWALDSLLSLYEYTENAEDIYSPEVFLRAAEIVEKEEDAGVRSLIYLLCEMVPYGQIPEEAKDSLAKTITRRKEYHAPIATALLTDPLARAKQATGRGTLRSEYVAFRKDVLNRLSGDIRELARLPLAEWVKLVQDIERLNLLTITDDPEEQHQLSRETFGIELEFAPYPYPWMGSRCLEYKLNRVDHIKERLSHVNTDNQQPEGLDSCSIDQGCIEVRTTGASHLTDETFRQLRETVRATEHFLPADVATFHLHVEREKKMHGFERLFALQKDNDNGPRGTLELRSFRPPTTLLQVPGGTKTRSQKTDIVAIERAVLFSTLSEDMPFFAYGDSTPPLLHELDGFPAREGVRKILSLALCGQDPRQRAAAIQLVRRPPLFLQAELIAEQIFGAAPNGRKIEYCLEGTKMVYTTDQQKYTRMWQSKETSLSDLEACLVRLRENSSTLSREESSALWRSLNLFLQTNDLQKLSRESIQHLIAISLNSDKMYLPVDIGSLLPMVEPQDLPRAIQHMRDAADTTKTYPWITEQPEIYAQIRIHLSQDDREYLYGRLLGVAKVHRQALRDVLQTHLSDASEQDRAMFYLMYGTLSEAADIRDAFAYIHAHTPTEESVRTFLPLQKEVLSWLPDQDPVLMRTLLTDKIIPELLLSEVWHAIFDQIYLVDWQDFIVSEYTKLDTRSRESIYFHLKREVLNDEYGRPVSPLLQSLFQECVAQEQDIGIKTRAIVLALHSGFLEDAFSAWKDILQAEFEKLEIKDCERLLEALVTTKDPVCLEFLGEFFPYKIAWSDMYTHRLIQQIAQNLALEGHAFLLGLYEHNPTPVVEHSIEQALPFMRQRVARPTRRRKASSHESLDHL